MSPRYLTISICIFRESEGSFRYGNYYGEADDLHAVIEHFKGANRVTRAILGHSKGLCKLPLVILIVDSPTEVSTTGSK